MDRIFYPRSLVVIGVSERADNLARNIVDNLLTFGYPGDLYAVGRRRGAVHGIDIHPSLEEVPDGLDLAVILTPAAVVPDLMETCGQKSIRRLVIESGGFSEFSPGGRQLEERLLEIARRWDLRFVGPNCISVINLEANLCLPFATIARDAVRTGPVSVVAQSGGVSVTYLDRLSRAGVGVNKVVSIGNKADLDELDYLSYLLEDAGTGIIYLYLESIDQGRRLMELAHSSAKPIILHKANRGQASQQIALSHTAALANDDRVVDAALRQASILRAQGFRDGVAMAQGLTLPPVLGEELVIISRSGGHAVVAADTAERHGFRLPPLPESLAQRVRSLFRADVITPTNPLDLGLIFDFDLYARVVEECLRSLTPDGVLLITVYSENEQEGAHKLAQRVEEIVRETGRPIALCPYGQGEVLEEMQRQTTLPLFSDIEEAVRGLAISRDWHRRRVEPLDLSLDELPKHIFQGAKRIPVDQILALLRAYSIPIALFDTAATPEEAVQAADRLGYPVALKLLAPEVVHKTDVGGVALGLEDGAAVRRAAEEMASRMPEARLMVQQMVEGGIEVILGGKWDDSFGPVILFGLGGVYVEVLDDVALRVAPLSRADAEGMIAEVKGSRLLEGVRGQPPMDREGLVQALLALSRLMVEIPHLLEIDVNPLIIQPQGVVAVDGRGMRRRLSD